MTVGYRLEPDLEPSEFIDVLVRSTLGERRPISKPDVIAAMLANADIGMKPHDSCWVIGRTV